MFRGSSAGSAPARKLPPLITEVVVPRIKSAKKRMRQAKTHATLNRTQRSELRTAIKKVRTASGPDAQAAVVRRSKRQEILPGLRERR